MKEKPQETYTIPHLLTLSDCRELSVSGVEDVDSFDEQTVVIYTQLGSLTVKGRELHVQNLYTETGDLSLEGEVESLTYSPSRRSSGGFFGKLFR